MDGKLIVIEGIDGTGKSTQVEMLGIWLKKKYGNEKVISLFEPTNSEYGKKIRESMANKKELLSFEEELELFMADRRWNVKENIIPALEKGKIVIMDRYYFSTAAYQGCRGVMDYREIIELNEQFAPIPDVLFVFFLNVDVALERLGKSREKKTYMEKADNLKKVQEIFSKIHYDMNYNSYHVWCDETVDHIKERLLSKVLSLGLVELKAGVIE